MNCTVTKNNLKLFHKSILALSKVGDELFIEVKGSKVAFRSLSNSLCAYGIVSFDDDFFMNISLPEGKRRVQLKLPIRSFLMSLRSIQSVEYIRLYTEEESNDLKLVLHVSNSMRKQYSLHVSESDSMQPVYKRDSLHNHVAVDAKILAAHLNDFHAKVEAITLSLSSNYIQLSCYEDPESALPQNILHTDIRVPNREFSEFSVNPELAENGISFPVKELRAFVAFAESVSQIVHLFFEKAGDPVSVICGDTQTTHFQAELVLASFVDASVGEQTAENSVAPTMDHSTREESVVNTSMMEDRPSTIVDESSSVAVQNTESMMTPPPLPDTIISRRKFLSPSSTPGESAVYTPATREENPSSISSGDNGIMEVEDDEEFVDPTPPPSKRKKWV